MNQKQIDKYVTPLASYYAGEFLEILEEQNFRNAGTKATIALDHALGAMREKVKDEVPADHIQEYSEAFVREFFDALEKNTDGQFFNMVISQQSPNH